MPEVTFYSKSPGLKCWAGKSKYENIEGTLKMVDPPFVAFTPLPGKPFGYYTTSDPEIIEYLTKRMETGRDVISEEQFAKEMIPAETRALQLEERVRQLEEQNRLLSQVKAQEAEQTKKSLPVPKG